MTMMNGLDVYDVELLDEEFFGPPPRFLRERPETPVSRTPRNIKHWLTGVMAFFANIMKLIRA
jgi:hypothetical protein